MATDRSLAQKIAAFFTPTAVKSIDGNNTNFSETDDPSEANFKKLMNSVPFFNEEESRAKIDSITQLREKTGIVTVQTDAEAKAGTTGLKADRTAVTHGSQLPTVEASEVQLIDGAFQADFEDVALVIADDGTTTRNNYLVSLASGFISFLAGITSQISTNVGNISNNTTLINNNTDAIDTLISAGSPGEVNDGNNVGTGEGFFRDKTGLNLNFRTLVNQDNLIDITSDSNQVYANINNTNLESSLQSSLDFTPTTTWGSLGVNDTNLKVSRLNGTGTGYTLSGFGGSIRYMILDKTLFLSVSVSLTINATGKLASGELSRVKIKLNVSPINKIPATNQSVSTFNATAGQVFAFDVASSVTNQEIYNVQGIPMPGGSTPLSLTVRGMIAVEIQ